MEFRYYCIVDTGEGPQKGWVMMSVGENITRMDNPIWDDNPFRYPQTWTTRCRAEHYRDQRLGYPDRYQVKGATLTMET